MKQVVVYLEKYAQWIALALGGLFLIFMIWSYGLNNPAASTIQIGGTQQVVAPGTIDKYIAEGPAAELDRQTKQTHSNLNIPVSTPTLPISKPAPARAQFALVPWDSDRFPIGNADETKPVHNAGTIASLPTLPALTYVDYEWLRTVLLEKVDANGQGVHVDTDAVTTFWELPVTDLEKSFNAAFGNNLFPQDEATIFVRGTLIGQEQTGANTWGPEVVIATSKDIPLPQNVPPAPVDYPPAGPDPAQVGAQYLDWAKHDGVQQSIVAAPFPPVAFNRADLLWQPLDVWIPQRAKQEALDATPVQNVAAVAPAPSQPPRSPRPGVTPRTPPPPPRPTIVTPPPRTDTGTSGTGETPGPVAPKTQIVPLTYFNPSQLVALNPSPMLLHFHDLTAEPGKTYHYKVRYTLLNPLYKKYNKVADAELADQFGIDSPDSAWSPTVTIPERTRFWCAPKQPQVIAALQQGLINFVVYAWHDGQWQQKDYAAVPGDEIGADESTDGNFLTHWTVLDVSRDNENRYALLVPDTGGDAQRRNVLADATGQDFKKFQREFNGGQQGEGGAAPPTAPQPGGFEPPVPRRPRAPLEGPGPGRRRD